MCEVFMNFWLGIFTRYPYSRLLKEVSWCLKDVTVLIISVLLRVDILVSFDNCSMHW